MTKYCNVHWSLKVHCPFYICYLIHYWEYIITYHHTLKDILSTLLNGLTKYCKVCTLIYAEYTAQSIFAHQLYTYSESIISPYTNNILSTLLKLAWYNLAVYTGLCGIHCPAYICSPSIQDRHRTATSCSLELRLFTVEMLQYQHLNPVCDGFSIWVYIAEVTLYLIITYFILL